MPRYLVRCESDRREEVKGELPAGVKVRRQYFDYIEVEAPEALVPRIRKIPGVISVRKARKKKIMYPPMPVEKKLTEFLSRDPLSALSFSAEEKKPDRLTTTETRRYIGANKAGEIGVTGKGIKVAVLDTGLDRLCTQLPPIPSQNTYSAVDGQPLADDENGHGTWCATCIGGRKIPTPFGSIMGMAPGAQIYHIKVLGRGAGSGSEADVMEGLMEAFRWGADIISMSLGSPYTKTPPEELPECRAIRMLTGEGIVCCVANGNSGPDSRTVGVPACEPTAFSVGAIDSRTGEVADFSSRGPTQIGDVKPDIIEPGVSILSSTVGLIDAMEFRDLSKLGSISGTSMATPHASGLVALIKQLYRENDIELTTDMLKDMVKKYGGSKDNTRGWGLLTFEMAERYLEEVL